MKTFKEFIREADGRFKNFKDTEKRISAKLPKKPDHEFDGRKKDYKDTMKRIVGMRKDKESKKFPFGPMFISIQNTMKLGR